MPLGWRSPRRRAAGAPDGDRANRLATDMEDRDAVEAEGRGELVGQVRRERQERHIGAQALDDRGQLPSHGSTALQLVRPGRPTAELGSDSRGQLPNSDRLGQVVVGPALEPPHAVRFRHRAGHEDDGQPSRPIVRPDLVQRFQAAEDRHAHVHEHDVDGERGDLLDRLSTVRGEDGVKAFAFEGVLGQRSTCEVVVHDKHERTIRHGNWTMPRVGASWRGTCSEQPGLRRTTARATSRRPPIDRASATRAPPDPHAQRSPRPRASGGLVGSSRGSSRRARAGAFDRGRLDH